MADAENTQSYTVGEMAHIKGEKPGSNRYDSSQDDSDRNSYENLILLCPTHHTIIDKPENEETYSVARLLKIKEEHEAFILRRLTSQAFRDKIQVARLIAPLLNRNRDVFLSFGPTQKLQKPIQ